MHTLPTFFAGLRFTARPAVVESPLLSRIRGLEKQFAGLDDHQLRTHSLEIRDRTIAANTTCSDDDVARAFALMGEATYRTHQVRFYDVQLLAGLSLLRNEIAEMKTGEGKTFVGALASYAQSLRGRGVHFMTTNDYLAQRDFETVQPMIARLGMTIGLIDRESSPRDKQAAYQCDITYGPGYEFGFDYLRDQLAMVQRRGPDLGERFQTLRRGGRETSAPRMQREHFCAIVDEADSVLIDEAITPLILSGSPGGATEYPEPYQLAENVAAKLIANKHFTVDDKKRCSTLTIAGKKEAAAQLDTATLRRLRRPWHLYVEQALRADSYFSRDADYVVADDKVKIVDNNTGRIFEDRSWSEGLHQAVEAKEGVPITEENHSLVGISRQQYFRLYENMCGMTGTAREAKTELQCVYGLTTTPIATHRPCLRVINPMRFFAVAQAKWDAIAKSVQDIHATGRPILIGTRTIEASETIAARLESLPLQLLNGKQDADESQMIAEAGKFGAITIATNMAGRGTDIRLASGVAELGGLHVIVTEPHDSAASIGN